MYTSFLARLFSLFLLINLGTSPCAHANIEDQNRHSLTESDLGSIANIVEQQILAGNTPGAVVLIGNQGRIVYRKAFGYQSLVPHKLPMVEDTVFDLASLTKVVATTTAVMQLVEEGKLKLDAPVARYWPEFGRRGKKRITVKQLLTHYSGLRADLDLRKKWTGYRTALRLMAAEKPQSLPNVNYTYSDINFAILGELVKRVSGLPLDQYCEKKIFKPLGMKDAAFRPTVPQNRIAPTELAPGEVHDPTARRMGCVAGHAGVFSTADDLSIFAQMLLDGGESNGVRILSQKTVDAMTIPQSPSGKKVLRGLGWKIDSPFVYNRDSLIPVGSYGHTGYTGTSLWIDPTTKSYIIILTNRVHPNGGGDVAPLRKEIAEAVSAALGPVPSEQTVASQGSFTGLYKAVSNAGNETAIPKVRTGIDVLASENYASLAGMRVGLITNHSGLDSTGRRTFDLLRNAPDVKVAALFSPEHGLYGNLDEKVASGTEPTTNLPVYSLYGNVRRPTDEMLEGLDALVFDIQDAGVRFYTYISTMSYAMEAAAKKGIDFYVLDRPNPINASQVQGPVMDSDMKSFTGCFPLPVRHGMTVGELARMFNEENNIGAKLHVIKMEGYERKSWYDETGLLWVSPSPNLRTLTETALYPGVAIVEGANVSVGRGTDTPFELLGAPWINGKKLASYLNKRGIKGVHFEPVKFKPRSDRYENTLCGGIKIALKDRKSLDSPKLGMEIASALYRLYPRDFQLDKTLGMIGARSVLQSIKKRQNPKSIAMNWQDRLNEFQEKRSRYLLY